MLEASRRSPAARWAWLGCSIASMDVQAGSEVEAEPMAPVGACVRSRSFGG
jgi:hypothetical protein